MSRQKTFTVGEAYAGYTLQRYLASQLSYLESRGWKGKIAKGMVEVNGEVAEIGLTVNPGDLVEVSLPERVEPEVDSTLRIAYEDTHFYVFEKSGNLPVHPSGVYFENTLTQIWFAQTGERLFPVHRIDRETSGLVLLARTKAATSALQALFNESRIEKTYNALVDCDFEDSRTMKGFICEDRSSEWRSRRMLFSPEKVNGSCKTSETLFVPVEKVSLAGQSFTRLWIRLVSGRKHQIRATLQSLGCPITGDMLYHRDETLWRKSMQKELGDDERREKLVIKGMALHSSSLVFPHPFEEKLVSVHSSFPDYALL